MPKVKIIKPDERIRQSYGVGRNSPTFVNGHGEKQKKTTIMTTSQLNQIEQGKKARQDVSAANAKEIKRKARNTASKIRYADKKRKAERYARWVRKVCKERAFKEQ